MNTILICNFIFLLTLTSARTKDTFADLYDGFLKLQPQHEEACLKENNISEAMMQKMIEDISANGVFPNKREYKCFLNCMLVKSNCINDKGLNLESVKDYSKAIHLPFLEKFMRDCVSKITDQDPCERGTRIEMCFSEEVKRTLAKEKK